MSSPRVAAAAVAATVTPARRRAQAVQAAELQAALVETAPLIQAAEAVLPEPAGQPAAGMRRQALHYPEEPAGLTQSSPQMVEMEAQGVRTPVVTVAKVPPADLVAAVVVQGTTGEVAAHHLIITIIRVRAAAADRHT